MSGNAETLGTQWTTGVKRGGGIVCGDNYEREGIVGDGSWGTTSGEEGREIKLWIRGQVEEMREISERVRLGGKRGMTVGRDTGFFRVRGRGPSGETLFRGERV